MLTLKYQSTQRGPIYFFQVESSFNFLSKDLSLIAYRRDEKALENNFTQLSSELLSTITFVPGVIFKAESKPGFHVLCVTFNDQKIGLLRNQDFTISLLKSSHFGMSTLHGDFMALAHFHAHLNHTDVAVCSPDTSKGQPLPEFEFRECKFDTLTFEQLGAIVRFPAKPVSTIGSAMLKRQYNNIEDHDLHGDISSMVKAEPPFSTSATTPLSSNKHRDVLYVPNLKYEKNEPDRLRREFVNAFDLTPLLDNSFDDIGGECLFPTDVFERDIVFVELPTKK